jgi:lysophospholipase L1-like esterase
MTRRNKGYRLTLITLGFVLAFLIGESACKIYTFFKNSTPYMQISLNPNLVVEPRPNIEYVNNFGMIKRLNSTGFEGPELADIDDEHFKIIFLGDSIVDGGYLRVDRRLPNLLQKKISAGMRQEVAVWNAGVGGYNSWQVLEFLKDKALNYQSDLIIIGICQNDFVEARPKVYKIFNRVFLKMRDGSRARIFNWLYQRSDLYKFAYDGLANFYRSRLSTEGYKKYLRDYHFDISRGEWKDWEGCIKETGLTVERDGSKILFVIFPLHSQIVQGDKVITEKLVELFREEGYDFVNLTVAFRSAYDIGVALYREHDIIHFNEAGSEIAVEAIFNYIKSKGYLLGRGEKQEGLS